MEQLRQKKCWMYKIRAKIIQESEARQTSHFDELRGLKK